MSDRTADGQPIIEGMIVFDNNVTPVRVGPLHYSEEQRFNGVPTGLVTHWYRVFNPVTGGSDGAVDGSRMATKMRRYDGSVIYPTPRLVASWTEEIKSWDVTKPEPDFVTDLFLPCPACGVAADPDGPGVRCHRVECAYMTAVDNAEAGALA
jgi:hypothetical protein